MIKIIVTLIALISYVNSQCGATVPYTNTDCLKLSDSNNYCCFTYNGINSKQCVTVGIASFIPTANPTLDCGVGAGTLITHFANTKTYVNPAQTGNSQYAQAALGPACGPMYPGKAEDCSPFSTMENSCCYYEIDGKTGCNSLGKRYVGTTTYGVVKVTCNECFLKFSSLVIFLIAIILL